MVAKTDFIHRVPSGPSARVTDKVLEDEFHRAMLDIYDRCAEHGYKPTQFREMVDQYGGCRTAHRLLEAPQTSGLAKLILLGLQEYSTEALVLREHFRPLFSPEEIEIATKRMNEPGPVSPV